MTYMAYSIWYIEYLLSYIVFNIYCIPQYSVYNLVYIAYIYRISSWSSFIYLHILNHADSIAVYLSSLFN